MFIEDLLSSYFVHGLVESDSRSKACFDLASGWLRECLQNHDTFCADHASPLPTRVLHVGSIGTAIQPYLMVTEGRLGKWVALSHCWGTGTPFTTTTTNLSERQRGIAFGDFPVTFQDAISICRRLGFEHLWIDSLCILQDSVSDWRTESAQMSHVYSNASVTLIAEASPNSHGGIFASANTGRLTTESLLSVPCYDSNGAYCGTIYPQKFNTGVGVAGSYEEGPLSSRAWALQEDVLSQRILRYSRDQLFWACRTSFHSESNPTYFEDYQMIYDPRNFRRQDMSKDQRIYQRHLLTFWYDILRRYHTQSLTFENDRFPAISGMAREIGVRGNYTYKAGIWQEDVHRGLLWSTTSAAKRTSQYIAPSWSWASLIDQTRDLYEKAYRVTENIAKIVYIDVTNIGDDVYGQVSSASLNIQSQWRRINPWDHKPAEVTSPDLDLFREYRSTPKRLRIYFDLDVTRGQRGLGQGIICIQIAKAKKFAEGDSIPPTMYALLLEPTNHGSSTIEYQRIGLAALPSHGKIMEEGWEQGTFTII
jgi:hypothetical protein